MCVLVPHVIYWCVFQFRALQWLLTFSSCLLMYISILPRDFDCIIRFLSLSINVYLNSSACLSMFVPHLVFGSIFQFLFFCCNVSVTSSPCLSMLIWNLFVFRCLLWFLIVSLDLCFCACFCLFICILVPLHVFVWWFQSLYLSSNLRCGVFPRLSFLCLFSSLHVYIGRSDLALVDVKVMRISFESATS